MNILKLKMKFAAFAGLLFFISCTNQTQDPAEVDNGVTDTTSIFAPDTIQRTDTTSSMQAPDSGFRP